LNRRRYPKGLIDDSDFFYDSDNIDHDLDTELEFLTMKNVLAIDMMLEKDSKSNVSLHMDFKNL
jgi:hypothetical protein